VHEINIQQLLDMMHCTLLHPQEATTTTAAEANKPSKFVTDIEKKEESKTAEATLSSYGFGAQFKYHAASAAVKSHKMFIQATHADLKTEILNNKLYRISDFDFASIHAKAQTYRESYRGRTLKARKQGALNRICRIEVNSAIELDHIIVLMLYTNMDELQREFKKGCRYLLSDNQKIDAVKERNREIAHWCRLLLEAITFFGESIEGKKVFYHGLSCKLLFTSVIAAFNCPTSTTVNKSVAYNFSTEQGIIVQLSKYASLDSHFLDVSDLSDYPNEQERLFFQAQLGFEDIIYNKTSHKYFIKCLSLFQSITKGDFFSHNSKIFKNKHQRTLLKMMDRMMGRASEEKADDEAGDRGEDKAKKKRKHIPGYMQDLFNHYCNDLHSLGNIIWLNKEEFSKLNDDMQHYLRKTGHFAKFLERENKTTVRYPKTQSLVVKDADLESFWKGNKLTLPNIEYEVEDSASKEADKPRVRVVLKLRICKGLKNDSTAVVMAKINNKELPDYVAKVKCGIGLFCPQINFVFQTSTTISRKFTGIRLCESVRLEGLDCFEWRIFVKFRARTDKDGKQYLLHGED